MVRISIIISLVLLACFVSGSNQERSDESLLGRVERHAGRRRKGADMKKTGRKRNRKTRGKKRGKPTGERKRGKKTRGKKERKAQRKCGRQSGPDDATCLANIGTVMDYEGNQVGNFERQKKRIESFNTLMGKKGGKKDDFTNSSSYLETSLGSDINCSKAGISVVADTAKETFTTLSGCSSSISAGCSVPAGAFNQTSLDSCLARFTVLKEKIKECYTAVSADSADLSAACTCFAAAVELVNEAKAASCSAKSSFDTIKASRDNCLGNFSACKKAEDASVGLIHSCNGGTTPTPPTTVAAPATTAGATSAPTTASPFDPNKCPNYNVRCSTDNKLGDPTTVTTPSGCGEECQKNLTYCKAWTMIPKDQTRNASCYFLTSCGTKEKFSGRISGDKSCPNKTTDLS